MERHDSLLGTWTLARWEPEASRPGPLRGLWYFEGELRHLRERHFPHGAFELIVHLGPVYREVREDGIREFAPLPPTSTIGGAMKPTVSGVPDGYHTVTPYLIVPDVPALTRFLEASFQARPVSEHRTPEGRVMHAEVQVGDSRIMMGEADGEWPARHSVIHLYMENVDEVYRRAVEAGGRSIREPETMFYGDRTGGVEDPWGNQWWVATRIEDVSPEEMRRRQEALREE